MDFEHKFALLVAVLCGLMEVAKRVFPSFYKSDLGQRLGGVLPALLGGPAALPLFMPDGFDWYIALLLGFSAGVAATMSFQTFRLAVKAWQKRMVKKLGGGATEATGDEHEDAKALGEAVTEPIAKKGDAE
jgi:hypothetical protein